MIQMYPAQSRYTADHGWLNSAFSFSFAEYVDPNNMNFGPLRVLNDDIIQPETGFGRHPHREMEIVTVVLKGQLKHEDSTGNAEILTVGEVQRMSAGTGIYHSEVNPSSSEAVNLLQLWFEPSTRGVQPSYEQFAYNQEAMANALLPVVSNQEDLPHRVAKIHQDLSLYLSKLEAGKQIIFNQEADRKIFVFVMEGDLLLNEEYQVNRRDSVRISDNPQLIIQSTASATFMLIDLP